MLTDMRLRLAAVDGRTIARSSHRIVRRVADDGAGVGQSAIRRGYIDRAHIGSLDHHGCRGT